MTRLGASLRWRFVWPGAVLVALCAPALVPLVRPGLWAAHDMFHHLFRVVELDRVLRGGVLYARWLPDLGFFYGYPVLNFYAPLTYYFTLLWRWAGAGYMDSLKVSYALSFLVAAWGAYRWAREVWPPWPSLWVAVAYTYAPYHLANAYVRGALAEHWAQALAPWLFWLAGRVGRKEEKGGTWLLLAVGMAGLVLTHNLSAFLLLPALAIYALLIRIWQGPQTAPWRRWGMALAGAFTLAAGLSAIYWLPALAEVRWIRAGQVAGQVQTHVAQLAAGLDWLSPFWVYRYYPHQGVPFEHPFSRWQAAVVLLGGLVTVIFWRRWSRPQRVWLAVSALFLAISLFLMTRGSAWLWVHLRPLAFLQFPWRLQGLAALVSAAWAAPLAAALAALTAGKGQARWLPVGTTAVFLALWVGTSMPYLPNERLTWPGETPQPVEEADLTAWGMAQYDFLNGLWAREYGDPWLMEYLPVTVRVPREAFWLPGQPVQEPYAPPDQVRVLQHCPTRFELEVVASQDTFIRWHQFWFPGWQAAVDGQPVEVMPSSALGVITVPVPAGSHRVDVWFGDTWPRQVGRWLTLASLGLLVIGLWKWGRRDVLALLAAGCLLWVGLWGWHNVRASTCEAPSAAWYVVGDRAAYLGCRVQSPSSRRVEVTAYWMALQPIPEDWKAFVHLVDASGATVAQHDAYPGENFSPTTRWEVGEIVPDVHTVPLPEEGPAWQRVRLGLYRYTGTVENLPWQIPSGQNVGTAWEGMCR